MSSATISTVLLLALLFHYSNAATFDVRVKVPHRLDSDPSSCIYVGVSSLSLRALLERISGSHISNNSKQLSVHYLGWCGGGQQLNPGQTWSPNVAAGTSQARIWPCTNCNFEGSGRGTCQTGDYNGLLQCQAFGAPPNTLVEYALNQFNNLDFFDISLVDGFNVPMEFSPNSGGCTRGITCTANINGQWPSELRAPGGCNNPCTRLQDLSILL